MSTQSTDKPVVVILRGLPGAGKSSYAASLKGAKIVSADHYFDTPVGYRYDKSKISDAHRACMRKFLDLLGAGERLVVVDNTNVRSMYWSPYATVADAMGYRVEIRSFWVPVDVSVARNIHTVPLYTVRNMAKSWEDVPFPWSGCDVLMNGVAGTPDLTRSSY